MVDVYYCSAWGSCDYHGSIIARLDLSLHEYYGVYIYDTDGTLLYFFTFDGQWLCMSKDGGTTTECYDRSCFEGPAVQTPPYIGLFNQGGVVSQGSGDFVASCPDFL